MNVSVVHHYIFSSNPSTFMPHFLFLILLLNLPCIFLNLTILLKILVKPHLWSFMNAYLSLLMSKPWRVKKMFNFLIFKFQMLFMDLHSFHFPIFMVIIRYDFILNWQAWVQSSKSKSVVLSLSQNFWTKAVTKSPTSWPGGQQVVHHDQDGEPCPYRLHV